MSKAAGCCLRVSSSEERSSRTACKRPAKAGPPAPTVSGLQKSCKKCKLKYLIYWSAGSYTVCPAAGAGHSCGWCVGIRVPRMTGMRVHVCWVLVPGGL